MDEEGHAPGRRGAAKVVVGVLGLLYLFSGLGLAAYAAVRGLAFDDDHSSGETRVLLYVAAAAAIWVLLTGIGAVVVALEAEETATAWLGGLGVLALGVVVAGCFAVWFVSRP